jgi:enoyl-CoA hydratase/carnithine racemase
MVIYGEENEKVWSKKVLDTLNQMSPISLAVTLEQIKRGLEIKSIEEAFNVEAQLVAGY